MAEKVYEFKKSFREEASISESLVEIHVELKDFLIVLDKLSGRYTILDKKLVFG